MKITITKKSGNWTFGTIGGYDFEIKHFEEPSIYGINEGRISKLWITKSALRETVASYDRGWDIVPILDSEIEATAEIITRFN